MSGFAGLVDRHGPAVHRQPFVNQLVKYRVLTLKNTHKNNMGKWIWIHGYKWIMYALIFFGNPVLAIKDHTLRDHNAYKTQFDRSLFLTQLSDLN